MGDRVVGNLSGPSAVAYSLLVPILASRAAGAWLGLVPAPEREHAHLGYGELTVIPRYLTAALATLAVWGAYIAGIGL